MLNKKFLLISAIIYLCTQTIHVYAYSEDTPDNWPCVQRYIPELSAAVIWPEPLHEISGDASESDSALENSSQDIVKQLANRRKDFDTASQNAEKYIVEHTGDQALLANRMFTSVFERIQRERKRIIQGIFRYTDRQRMLGKRIEEQRRKLKRLVSASAESEVEQREDLEARQTWDIRAFRERERQLNFLCEQPVLLEQRLFEVAKSLQKYLQE